MSEPLHIVIDTREQAPWHFEPDRAVVKRGTLRTGDYALDGDEFAIERKSLDDFVGSIASGWGRFRLALERMSGWPAKVIIVEGRFLDLVFHTRQGEIIPPAHSHYQVTPEFVSKRIAEITMMGVSILFCETPELAAAMAWRILKERQKQIEQDE